MSESSRLFSRAVFGFDAVVRRAPPDGWTKNSPCEEWNARDVVSHVAMACSMITGMAQGEPAIVEGTEGRPAPGYPGHVMRSVLADMMEYPVIQPGDDVTAVWERYRDEVLTAIDDPASLDQQSMGTFGPTTPGEFIVPVGYDFVIHTWDLAVAVGVDHAIEPAMATSALAGFSGGEDAGAPLRQPNVMDERVNTSLTDPVSQLIAFSGRNPRWPSRPSH
jgi:uncharacterized protein (TIGR03083 family)